MPAFAVPQAGASLRRLSVLAAAILLAACSDPPSPSGTERNPAKVSEVPRTAGGKSEATVVDQEDSPWKALPEAIEGSRAAMADTTDASNYGAISLLLWSLKHLSWNDLRALPTTTAGKIMKDSIEERGKLICASGYLIEITAQRLSDEEHDKYFEGGMVDYWGNIYSFLAVKSSGDLVRGSAATFCGVVTGIHSYTNVNKGLTRAVLLVGMFRLSENLPKATAPPSKKSARPRPPPPPNEQREEPPAPALPEPPPAPPSPPPPRYDPRPLPPPDQASPDQPTESPRGQTRFADGREVPWAKVLTWHISVRWVHPANLPPSLRCKTTITLRPNGEVASVEITEGSGNEAFDTSVREAVLKSSPMPLPGDPAAFSSVLIVTFTPESLAR